MIFVVRETGVVGGEAVGKIIAAVGGDARRSTWPLLRSLRWLGSGDAARGNLHGADVHCKPTWRGRPRWSVASEAAAVSLPASMAGEPAKGGMQRVGPPWLPTAARAKGIGVHLQIIYAGGVNWDLTLALLPLAVLLQTMELLTGYRTGEFRASMPP